jgi:hypothetical protein
VSTRRANDDAALRLLAFGLTDDPGHRRYGVVDDLALEGRHGIEADRRALVPNALGRPGPEHGELLALAGSVTADVEHQPATNSGLAVDGQPGQLLQRLQGGAVRADKAAEVGADDGHRRAVALHVDVDVAVDIRDVQ